MKSLYRTVGCRHLKGGRGGGKGRLIFLAVLFDPSTGKGSGPFLLYLYSPLSFSTQRKEILGLVKVKIEHHRVLTEWKDHVQ